MKIMILLIWPTNEFIGITYKSVAGVKVYYRGRDDSRQQQHRKAHLSMGGDSEKLQSCTSLLCL